MLEKITQSFVSSINKIRFYDDEKSLKNALLELKKSLLKADVYHKTVKDLLLKVELETKKGQIGKESFYAALKKCLFEILEGSKNQGFVFASKPPTKVLMTGLQGSGKTTTTAKIALDLKGRKKKVLLVPADLERPGAKEQLRQLAQEAQVEIFLHEYSSVLPLAKDALKKANDELFDVVIFDTAGRLAIDEKLMKELQDLKAFVNPDEIIYVADSLTGQDAVKTANIFKEQIGATSIALTKFDGNPTGGIAIGLASQTGLPLRFLAVGEKIQDLENFIPARIVSRLIGEGDKEGLAEKVSSVMSEKKAKEITKKIKKGAFNFEDFLEQLETIKKMGSLKSLVGMIPGLGNMGKELAKIDPENSKELDHIKALINSMTKKERQDPDLLNLSRKKRIALGAGLSEAHVNRVLKQFKHASKFAKKMTANNMANIGSMLGGMNKGQFR